MSLSQSSPKNNAQALFEGENLRNGSVASHEVEKKQRLVKSTVKMALEGCEYLEIRKAIQAEMKRALSAIERRVVSNIIKCHKRPILGLDSGTSETKLLQFRQDGSGVETSVLGTLPDLKSIFGEARDDDWVEKLGVLKAKIREGVENAKPVYCFAGVTSWYRASSVEVRQRVDNFFEAELPEFELLKLSGEEEARFESIAVAFAAEKSGIGIPDTQISAGGGSMQLVQGDNFFSIEQGFRTGQSELMAGTESNTVVYERLRERARAVFSEFKEKHSNFMVKDEMKVVGISAAFYCAKGAGVDCSGAAVKASAALAIFKAKRDKLTKAESFITGSEPMPKKVAQEIANLCIFCECFEQLVRPNADVFFKRDWVLDDVPFITTWTSGYFLHERRAPSNVHRQSLLSAATAIAAEEVDEKGNEKAYLPFQYFLSVSISSIYLSQLLCLSQFLFLLLPLVYSLSPAPFPVLICPRARFLSGIIDPRLLSLPCMFVCLFRSTDSLPRYIFFCLLPFLSVAHLFYSL